MKGNLFINSMAIVLFALPAAVPAARAQQISYSVPLGDNVHNTSFDIIGLCGGRLLIYMESFGDHKIVLYDKRMSIAGQVPLTFLPGEVKQTDFINLGDKVGMFYQYTRRGDIYCRAVMLNDEARPLAKPLLVDKIIHPGRVAGGNAYAVVHSKDKNRILVFAVLRNDDSMLFHIRAFLFDSTLQLLQKEHITVPYFHEAARLEAFRVSDKGGIYFIRGNRHYAAEGYYQGLTLYYWPGKHKEPVVRHVLLHGHPADTALLLKVDEPRGRLRLAMLCYDEKLRDIDRLVTLRFSSGSLAPADDSGTVMLADALQSERPGKHTSRRRAFFNDYHLKDMVTDKRGNALLAAEEEYTDVNGNTHSNNLALWALDAGGNLLRLQLIKKEQGNDLGNTFASYLLVNTGGALHFLMNHAHRVFRFLNSYVYLLTDYRYDAGHRLQKMPVMRGLDDKTRWAPRYGVQVSRHEVVIPCVRGNSLLFGKITW